MSKSASKGANKATVAPAPGEDDWRAESDMRTLHEAEKIKADKPRHKRAISKAQERLKELQTVAAMKPGQTGEPTGANDNDGDE